ncbi:hypothetical protein BDR05DRAFT_964972 [Suillus weaverae]|nr:hypothetical protein BDR05DRAFT_964972 [Suillus weaverae]
MPPTSHAHTHPQSHTAINVNTTNVSHPIQTTNDTRRLPPEHTGKYLCTRCTNARGR